MYRHLFFDADGTLFDFDRAEQQAFALMAQELSLPSDESAFARYKSCNEECWKLFEKGMVTLAQLKTQRFDRFFSSLSLEGDSEKASASYQYHLSGQGILFEQSIKVLQVLTERGYTLYLPSNDIADVQ